MPTRLMSEVDDPSVTVMEHAIPGDIITAHSDRAEKPTSSAEDDVTDLEDGSTEHPGAVTVARPVSRVRSATLVSILMVVALAGVVGWLTYRSQLSHRDAEHRES